MQQNCPICLEEMKMPARLDSCFHSFCFACIVEWARQTVTCPLCKSAFGSLIHSFDSKGTQFERTYMTKDILDSIPVVATDQQKTNRKAVYAQKLVPSLIPISPYRLQMDNNNFRSDNLPKSQRQQRLAGSSLPAVPSISFPYTLSSELTRWLRRDLLILLCSEGMETRQQLNDEIQQELAMLLHLIARAFQEAHSWPDVKQRLLAKLAPILGSLPQHMIARFIAEIGHYLASPFKHSIEEYDSHVRYQPQAIVLDPEVVVIDDSEFEQNGLAKTGMDVMENGNRRNERQKARAVIRLDDDGEVIISDDDEDDATLARPRAGKEKQSVHIDSVEEMAVIVIEEDLG